MNNIAPFAGIVLLITAATTINAPPVIWNPSWTVRLMIGGAGVLTLLFSVIGRRQPPSK
jgi:hypothetical protein